jgi:hypothetical protein
MGPCRNMEIQGLTGLDPFSPPAYSAALLPAPARESRLVWRSSSAG